MTEGGESVLIMSSFGFIFIQLITFSLKNIKVDFHFNQQWEFFTERGGEIPICILAVKTFQSLRLQKRPLMLIVGSHLGLSSN